MRLGFLLYRSWGWGGGGGGGGWGWGYERLQKFWRKGSSNSPFTHGGTGTGTSKCGTDTKSVLPVFSRLVPPLFSWLVLIPVSVVLVPLCFYLVF